MTKDTQKVRLKIEKGRLSPFVIIVNISFIVIILGR